MEWESPRGNILWYTCWFLGLQLTTYLTSDWHSQVQSLVGSLPSNLSSAQIDWLVTGLVSPLTLDWGIEWGTDCGCFCSPQTSDIISLEALKAPACPRAVSVCGVMMQCWCWTWLILSTLTKPTVESRLQSSHCPAQQKCGVISPSNHFISPFNPENNFQSWARGQAGGRSGAAGKLGKPHISSADLLLGREGWLATNKDDKISGDWRLIWTSCLV